MIFALAAILLEAFAKGAALAVSVFLSWKQNSEKQRRIFCEKDSGNVEGVCRAESSQLWRNRIGFMDGTFPADVERRHRKMV